VPAIAPSQAAIAQARREIRELQQKLAAVKAQRDTANSELRAALSAQRQLQARVDAFARAPRPSTTALPKNPQTFDTLSTVHGPQ
jgi:chromosome segregation ATPase